MPAVRGGGSRYRIAIISEASAYTPAATKNTLRRPTIDARMPPITGPMAGPIRWAVWTVAMARPMRSGGADSAAIASVSGP
jgi:hypothetical protein